MTQLGPDVSVIELGVPGAEDRARGGIELPAYLRRRVLVGLVAVLCLLTLAASVRGRPGLGKPLWTGTVSLNGFTVGAHGLYLWRVDGKAVTAVDLLTGRPRWSRDVTELPDSIADLGNGVTVVVTRPLTSVGAGFQGVTITLVRDGTGERIAQTTGDYYVPSGDGRTLLVFSRRFDNPDSCTASDSNCVDVTAWNAGTGAVGWKLNLPPGTDSVPAVVDGRVEALAEIGAGGTVTVRDVSTGAVAGSVSLPPGVLGSGGQIGLVRGALLTAQRGPEGITVTGYRRPSLDRTWSVTVPDFTVDNDRGDGEMYLWECAPDACLMVRGAAFWIIDQSTGTVSKPIDVQLLQRLGGGVFLASPMRPDPLTDPTDGRVNGLVVDPNGRVLARLSATGLVDWSDSGDRGLVTREGPRGTDFRLIDSRGTVRTLGSVSGTGLTCHAHADILACSDPAGRIRVWRLPL